MYCGLCIVIVSRTGLQQKGTVLEKGCGPRRAMFLSLSGIDFGDILH